MTNKSIDIGLQLLIFIVAILILVINSSIFRPIWVDEFLHFVLGAMSFQEAISNIYHTTVDINHGQTGVYMLLDFLLLKIFGANLLALRLPSILSGIFLVISAMMFFREKRIHLFWQLLYLIILSKQTTLLYFVGEARPYMPLAASVVGCLAYYSVNIEDRNKLPVQLIGWCATCWGVSMHPYFIAYWFALCVFCFIVAISDDKFSFTIKNAINFVNLRLLCVGLTIFISLGLFTWLKGSPEFKLDPFQWLGGESKFIKVFNDVHYEFIGNRIFKVIFFIYLLFATFIAFKVKNFRKICMPLLLMALALIMSLFLSYVSYHRHYWILPRQWVASLAIISIGFIWLLAEAYGLMIRRGYGKLANATSLIFLALLFSSALKANLPKFEQLVVEFCRPITTSIESSVTNEKEPINIDEWLALANKNTVSGGEVYPVFKEFYKKQQFKM